ncbi:MAG: ester cyclase [Actinomycetota bacterium]|nr:ester cyclase [Actinomycetota bacterium]
MGFYTELFGWEATSLMPPESSSEYYVCKRRGREVAAIGSGRGAPSVPAWNTYIWVESAAEQHAALSDIRYIIEYQATDGDMVISRLTMRGTHDRGTLFGVAPTGKEWATPLIVINRVSGGKIAEEWSEDIVTPFLEEIEQRARESERVEQEFRVARRIQRASLPEECLN